MSGFNEWYYLMHQNFRDKNKPYGCQDQYSKAFCHTPVRRSRFNFLPDDPRCFFIFPVYNGVKHPNKIDREQNYGNANAVFVKG